MFGLQYSSLILIKQCWDLLVQTNDKKLKHLKTLSHLLDSKFEGPFGIRFGLDALLGFIPVLGDIITTIVSVYIVVQAALMGAGPSLLIRMAINLAIDAIIDIFPFVGNFFDFFWKANNKNIHLLERYLENPRQETFRARITLSLLGVTILAALLLSGYTAWMALELLYNIISGLIISRTD